MEKHISIILLIVFLVLTACGTAEIDESEATATIVNTTTSTPLAPTETVTIPPTASSTPVNTPTPVPTNTSTPPPTPDFTQDFEGFEDREIGISFEYPSAWIVSPQGDDNIVILTDNFSAFSGNNLGDHFVMLFYIEPRSNFDLEEFIVSTGDTFVTETGIMVNAEVVSELKEITIGNRSIAQGIYQGDIVGNPNTSGYVYLTVIPGEDQFGLVLGIIPASQIEGFEPIHRAIVDTIEITSPGIQLDANVFVVADYDPERLPAKDVAYALQLAQEEEKRVLLIVGGDWCITCHVLDSYINENTAVSYGLGRNFKIVKINFSDENQNEEFLAQYPSIEWYPHFFVLESDGSLALSLDTRELETDGMYDDEKFVTFLDQWNPIQETADNLYLVGEYDPTRDPFADLEAAILQAEAENKHILLIVGGEWCLWCHILEDFISSHPETAEIIQNGFVVIKVNYSDENANSDFLAQYPPILGYPHFFILNNEGELIHSQQTNILEEGQSYNEGQFNALIFTWSPLP